MTDIPVNESHHRRSSETWERQLLTGVSVHGNTHNEQREGNLAIHDVVTRMAVMTVRRACNRHTCTLPSEGRCEHSDARKDADLLRHVLDVLGLPGDFQTVSESDKLNLLSSLSDDPAIDVDRYSEVIDD